MLKANSVTYQASENFFPAQNVVPKRKDGIILGVTPVEASTQQISKQPSPNYMTRTKANTSDFKIAQLIAKEKVRVGKGITGLGTKHMNPQLSGRLTLGMLQKMEKARKLDQQFEGVAEENEFAKIRKLLIDEKRLVEERELLEKAIDKIAEKNAIDKDLIELRRILKENLKAKKLIKEQLITELKVNFKHITGMWPKNANFESEEDRMAHW